ncbi:MAG: hypothetical protein Q8O37_16085 [Sulfuricellaceae bacterium]|nr:hypothetical protein [Sulfuricellaceae bacterium]
MNQWWITGACFEFFCPQPSIFWTYLATAFEEALPAEVWLFILPFGIGMLLLEELRKALLRNNQDTQP